MIKQTYFGVITRGGAPTGDDGPLPNICLVAQKKVQFDVHIEKETFFDTRDMLNRNTGKLPIYEMPPIFDLTTMPGSSRKGSTLQNFLESCLLLEKYPDALEEITSLLY